MLTILALLIGSVTIFILLPLVIVVLGIRQEPPTEELSQQASSLLAAFVRRLLGLHVRKPDSPANPDQGAEDHASHVLPRSRTPMHKPNSNDSDAVRRKSTSGDPYRKSRAKRVIRAERTRPQLREVKKLLQAYTVEQVAEMLHVGRDKVYYLLRTGQLRSIKIGKLRRITEQHLAAFIASREDVADAS
jgi:excisionase family DNA binding protein